MLTPVLIISDDASAAYRPRAEGTSAQPSRSGAHTSPSELRGCLEGSHPFIGCGRAMPPGRITAMSGMVIANPLRFALASRAGSGLLTWAGARYQDALSASCSQSVREPNIAIETFGRWRMSYRSKVIVSDSAWNPGPKMTKQAQNPRGRSSTPRVHCGTMGEGSALSSH